MKKLLLLLFIIIACSRNVNAQARIAEDSIYTYHSGVIIEDKITHATDEVAKFYLYSDGKSVSSMSAEMFFPNYSMTFDVDSITARQMDSVNMYFGVTGKFHIDGAVFPGSILIVRNLSGPKRTIFIYIKQNIYTFYN